MKHNHIILLALLICAPAGLNAADKNTNSGSPAKAAVVAAANPALAVNRAAATAPASPAPAAAAVASPADATPSLLGAPILPPKKVASNDRALGRTGRKPSPDRTPSPPVLHHAGAGRDLRHDRALPIDTEHELNEKLNERFAKINQHFKTIAQTLVGPGKKLAEAKISDMHGDLENIQKLITAKHAVYDVAVADITTLNPLTPHVQALTRLAEQRDALMQLATLRTSTVSKRGSEKTDALSAAALLATLSSLAPLAPYAENLLNVATKHVAVSAGAGAGVTLPDELKKLEELLPLVGTLTKVSDALTELQQKVAIIEQAVDEHNVHIERWVGEALARDVAAAGDADSTAGAGDTSKPVDALMQLALNKHA